MKDASDRDEREIERIATSTRFSYSPETHDPRNRKFRKCAASNSGQWLWVATNETMATVSLLGHDLPDRDEEGF